MSGEVSPTSRALRTLELLRRRPATAGEIAAELGVTERAARRYVAILREAGVPVDALRGPHGGYRLGRGTRLPPVAFTEVQALGLVMAVLDGHPSAAADDDLVGTALGKVIRALPEQVGRQAAALREGAATTPDRYGLRVDPAVVVALLTAVAARRGVQISYSADRVAEVEPWAVVARHGRWYLLGRSVTADQVRTYRLDRVHAVEQTSRRCSAPDDLDPVTALEEHLGRGWPYVTRVAFQAPTGDVAPWTRPPMGRLEPTDEGCVLLGSTRNPAMYAQEWLLGIPVPFRVDGGPELRAAMATLAARCTTALGHGPRHDATCDPAADQSL